MIEPIEPDFKFILHPEEDLRNNPNYTYVRPGYEILDIYLEWRVYFWNEGLMDNYLTVVFDRNDIFLQYHKMNAMTTSEKILNYATMQGGTFNRKDLLHYIVEKYILLCSSEIFVLPGAFLSADLPPFMSPSVI